MRDAFLAHEPYIRLAAFGGVFAVMAIWELFGPRRPQAIGRGWRWPNNLGVVLVDALLVRILFPTAAVGFALVAEAHGFGLFNMIALPAWIGLVASVLLLDLAIYLQHVLFHAVPALWRLHRMHHADLEFDVTTGLRFHPIEILLSMLIKFAVVAALGAPALAVLIFEVLLNATAMFNHSNIRMPVGLDRVLRWFVVTPDMHRVHHSIVVHETNSNFGFNLPWWDRLCGTYRPQPAAGHEAMTIGIEQFRDPRELGLDRMLLQPFRDDAGRHPLGQRESDGSVTWIEADDLKRQLDSEAAVTVIDVRGPDEFFGPLGHIASARNIPVNELTARAGELAGLERSPIVLVCRTDKRSAAAAQTLRAAGLTQVKVLRRGMEQWNEAGFPVGGRSAEAAA